MTTKTELLNAIDGIANYLNQVSYWYNSPNVPFGHINNKSQSDYIYEFYCYLRFVNDLSKAGNLIQFNKSGFKGPSFPKKPSEKSKGWAKFEIILNNQVYDICAGIKIFTNIPNYSYAADISLQSNTLTPYPVNVYLIIDAKYKNNPQKKIPLSQLREFKSVVNELGFPKNIPIGINLNGTAFKIPTIVTNGNVNVKHTPYSNLHHFEQIGNFIP